MNELTVKTNQDDAIDFMRCLQSGSIDLIATDPPYEHFTGRLEARSDYDSCK